MEFNIFVRITISLVRIQSATRAMLQKQLIIQNTKLLLKMTISNLKKICTNTALFDFGLPKSDIRQFPNYFLTIFDFALPFFKALSQDG